MATLKPNPGAAIFCRTFIELYPKCYIVSLTGDRGCRAGLGSFGSYIHTLVRLVQKAASGSGSSASGFRV